MSSPELAEELDAIKAIYPESVEELAPEIHNFALPNHEDVKIQLSFPLSYPMEQPQVIQVMTTNIRKFPDVTYIERKVSEIINRVFKEGDVLIFELFEELDQFLQSHEQAYEEDLKRDQKNKELQLSQAKATLAKEEEAKRQGQLTQPIPDKDVFAGWVISDPVIDRGSTFIAYAREVHSVDEAVKYFELLTTDRKISRAAHNMNTWRIKGENGVQYQDCDDDGETAAGLRMLHLLTVCFGCEIHYKSITNSADHGCVERYSCGEQMVRRYSPRAGPVQAHQHGSKRCSHQRWFLCRQEEKIDRMNKWWSIRQCYPWTSSSRGPDLASAFSSYPSWTC